MKTNFIHARESYIYSGENVLFKCACKTDAEDAMTLIRNLQKREVSNSSETVQSTNEQSYKLLLNQALYMLDGTNTFTRAAVYTFIETSIKLIEDSR